MALTQKDVIAGPDAMVMGIGVVAVVMIMPVAMIVVMSLGMPMRM
jgi:hypothetical protein